MKLSELREEMDVRTCPNCHTRGEMRQTHPGVDGLACFACGVLVTATGQVLAQRSVEAWSEPSSFTDWLCV